MSPRYCGAGDWAAHGRRERERRKRENMIEDERRGGYRREENGFSLLSSFLSIHLHTN